MESIIETGEWLPDLPDFGNKGATIANNVLPEDGGYGPLPRLATIFGTLTTRCQGFFPCRDSAGVVYNFAGDSERLYKLINVSWSDISTSSFSYATATDEYWEFVQWNDRVIATNGTDPLQTTSISNACAFASNAGAPPVGKHLAVVKDFVVLGNISGFQNRVQWCAIDNPDSWTITVATQCDFQDIRGNGGQVQRIVGGEYGTVFQERQIVRMQYVGDPAIFSFEPIDRQRGAWNSASVVPLGDVAFYLSETGFFMFDGSKSVPISNRRMERTFMRDLDIAYVPNVFGAADVERNIVMWIYPGSGNKTGIPNKAVIFNWIINKWSQAEFECELLAAFRSPGYTLEELDNISTDVDALPYSMDSRAYQGGLLSFCGFNTAHKLAVFGGTPLDATVETGEVQHAPGMRSLVRGVRPLVDGDSATVAVGTRDLLSGTHSFNSQVSQNASGICPQRVDSRYHRYRVKTSGEFRKIQGVEVKFEPGGER